MRPFGHRGPRAAGAAALIASTFIALASMGTAAFAQRQGGGGWGGFGRGGGITQPGAMVEHGKKMYVVSQATLARVDLKTFEVEERVDLTGAGRDEEQEKKERKAWIARSDRNGDGVVDEAGDGDRWRWVRWFDANQDGKVTPDEAMISPAPGAAGPAVLEITGGKLIMLRGGTMFRFDLKTLDLEASARIPPPEPEPEPAAAPAKKEGDDAGKQGEGKKEVF